jgi:hypothetical protein
MLGLAGCLGLCICEDPAASQSRTLYSFDDRATDYEGGHPAWFKRSFLELDEDLDEALENGRSGLIVYARV